MKPLELIVLRNEFYNDNYYKGCFIVVALVLFNLFLGALLFYMLAYPPTPRYFAATPDGRMISAHPLSDPIFSDSVITQFSANAVRNAFSLDYVHWKDQLQAASVDFTPYGWRWFVKSFKDSNNLKSLEQLKMVASVKVTGAPEVLEKQIISGQYVWKVSMPILVRYQPAKGASIQTPMKVTVIVIRVPVTSNAKRIAINNFIPELLAGGLNA